MGDTLEFSQVKASNCIAKATFRDSIDREGWDTLYLEVLVQNEASYYAIGVLEGLLSAKKTQSFIKSYIRNLKIYIT